VVAPIGTVDMSLFAILLFVGTMVLSLWATMRVRQVYGEFIQLPESSGLTRAAALGVAAHECSHAIQHKQAYAPLQWRMASVGLTTFDSQIVLWLPLLGMFTGSSTLVWP
jgi:Zn-dependent membrane protease YugP